MLPKRKMSDEPKKAEKKMKREIAVCADVWLAVFAFLPASQLGLQIALLSYRFDHFVDEHFKMRKWTLGFMRIWRKSPAEKCGTVKMRIVNANWKEKPIPEIAMPGKVVGFDRLILKYIDESVVPFLHFFRPLFASCGTNLAIESRSFRVLEFVGHQLLPMISARICGMKILSGHLRYLRQFSASILDDCSSLRSLFCVGNFFPKFPADGSAGASSSRALAHWLCSPRSDGVPKLLRCDFNWKCQWTSKIEGLKTAFANASSPVCFVIVIVWHIWIGPDIERISVPFSLRNALTEERLALKLLGNQRFLIVRCPIARNEQKWAQWEREATEWEFDEQWNRIIISASESGFSTEQADTSDHQLQQED